MWIMLIKKIRCEYSPPKLSIHFSYPWELPEYTELLRLYKLATFDGMSILKDDEIDQYDDDLLLMKESELEEKILDEAEKLNKSPKFEDKRIRTDKIRRALMKPDLRHGIPDALGAGWERNPYYARGIIYKGEKIKIFGDEYAEITAEQFNEYFPAAYDFIPTENTSDFFNGLADHHEMSDIYDAALLDGCTPYQAYLVKSGKEIETGVPDPLGWYKIKLEYGEAFCTDEEMEE
jgi:hypothetical protein